MRALRRAGLVIEGRRVRTPHAEVDVLARDGAGLVVVEIKTVRRVSVPGPRGALRDATRCAFRAGGRLEPAQLRRLRRAAAWMAQRRRARVRIELVEVRLPDRGGAIEIDRARPDP